MRNRTPFHPRGYLMLVSIVFGAILFLVLGGLSGFVLIENKVQNANIDRSMAFALAEAGLEYYRWHLAHFPSDLQNGTGVAGPYVSNYDDPEGGVAGTYSLDIEGNLACGQVTSIDITSTGQPTGSYIQRTISARYTRPTVAQFSYVLNDTVWAGADRIINGPYHSNGGIRMDGTANAPVTSSLSTWLCTSSFGCSPNATKNGVWGAGPNQTLWSYPAPQVDFSGIAADFGSLKTTAIASGLYFARYSSGTIDTTTYNRGYHVIFNGNGTFTVRRVSNEYVMDVVPIYNPSDSSENDYTRIRTEALLGTYTIPATCGLIYFEDNVWIEGTVDTKVTLVAANVVDVGVAPNVVLRGNISYGVTDGSDGLTVLSENNVLIAADSPTTMTLNGIFIAQTGAFGRSLYKGCSAAYEPKGTLTIRGTTVSSKRTGTKWLNGCGSGDDAGYQTRIDAYDRQLSTDPPPFTPAVSNDYQFVDWREE